MPALQPQVYVEVGAALLFSSKVRGRAPEQFFYRCHEFGRRVLEVDDVEQASLLNRVWQPDVAVLDPAIA